ncbi:MAG: hypothetical protein M3464_22665 [Chloroflexota bacterium]|nr:hypothetical protein [Chloroflexota bacterium]
MSDPKISEPVVTSDRDGYTVGEQMIRNTFGLVRGAAANPAVARDIPMGATIVLIPDDDPELAEAEMAAGMAALGQGQDVYFRHIRPGDIIRGAE